MTLTEFLLERLEEDEEWAQLVPDRLWFVWADGYAEEWDGGEWADGRPRAANRHQDYATLSAARVLAECTALRGIVTEHGPDPDDHDCCRTCGHPDAHRVEHPCRTLRLLAAAWAGHEDYQPDWAVA